MKYLTLVLVVVLTVILVASCAPAGPVANNAPTSSSSNGERIYFTATSGSGESISYTGGFFMMHDNIACVNCHGPEGKGGRVTMMMRSFRAPDITWGVLTGTEHIENGDGHEEHPPYTEETLKTAITRGVNPAGESLDENMPRWRMTDEDLDDLIEFLKTR